MSPSVFPFDRLRQGKIIVLGKSEKFVNLPTSRKPKEREVTHTRVYSERAATCEGGYTDVAIHWYAWLLK